MSNAAQKSEVVTIEPPQSTALTPMEMVQHAIERGASVEVIGRMMDFQERWDRMQARKAFDAAMSAAKAEIPVVTKNREVDFTNKEGKRTNYRFEDLAGIARIIDPILSKHGLSYRYRATSEPNQPVSVTCIISHRDGHSEETTLTAGRDEGAGKNSIQAVGSTITYLQRYSLKAALGLAASNDDDGKHADAGASITADQLKTLETKFARVGGVSPATLAYFEVASLAELPAKDFDRVLTAVNKKIADLT
jgi:hypothetical protein